MHSRAAPGPARRRGIPSGVPEHPPPEKAGGVPVQAQTRRDSRGAGVNGVPGALQSRTRARPQAGDPVRRTRTPPARKGGGCSGTGPNRTGFEGCGSEWSAGEQWVTDPLSSRRRPLRAGTYTPRRRTGSGPRLPFRQRAVHPGPLLIGCGPPR